MSVYYASVIINAMKKKNTRIVRVLNLIKKKNVFTQCKMLTSAVQPSSNVTFTATDTHSTVVAPLLRTYSFNFEWIRMKSELN